MFSWCSLGLYQIYGSDPDHIGCFLAPKDTDCEALVVQIWSPGSQGVFARVASGTNSHQPGQSVLRIPLTEVLLACMERLIWKREACKSAMSDTCDVLIYCRVMLDSRLPFMIRQGRVINFVLLIRSG
jgi:hypothetical protein